MTSANLLEQLQNESRLVAPLNIAIDGSLGAADADGLEPLVPGADGFHFDGSASATNRFHTPSWISPEAMAAMKDLNDLVWRGAPSKDLAIARVRGSIQTTGSNIYQLGLLTLRLLHVPENPHDPDTLSVRESASAEASLARVAGAVRAGLVLSMFAPEPSSDVLAAFPQDVA